MRTDPLDLLPSISKIQVMNEYRSIESSKIPEESPSRKPTMALRLALSVFGSFPKEGYVPMGFFAEEDVQIYLGLPNHPLNKLLLFTGQTTSRMIVDAVFPKHREKGIPPETRFLHAESLPLRLKAWLNPVSNIIKRVSQDGWEPPPLNVLNFRQGRNGPWICRAEHLSGQVLDGTHRVLAYTILGSEFPNTPVRIRLHYIHPAVLAILNSLTIAIRFFMDPFRTLAYVKKRFGGSACFKPIEILSEKK